MTFSLLLLLALLAGCSKKDKIGQNSDTWAPYLHSHTQGEISRFDPLRIRFVEGQVTESSKGSEFKGRLELEPSVPGKLTWEDPSTLLFTPNSPWDAKVKYIAKLYPDNLQGVPQGLPPYSFTFSALSQSMEIQLEGFAPSSPTDKSFQDLSGYLITTDKSLPSEVKDVLSAMQNNQELAVVWTFDPQGRKHLFQIKKILRVKKEGKIDIKLIPKKLGIDAQDFVRTLIVPSILQFTLLYAKAEQVPQQFIHLQFSDPLDPNANYAGLIQVTGQNDLRFTAQGNTLKVFFKRRVVGSVDLNISGNLASASGNALKNDVRTSLEFKVELPGLRFVGKGVILPDAEKITAAFEAVNLNAVDVEVFQIFENNMGQFFQSNTLTEMNDLKRVGRYLWRKKITLESDSSAPGEWTRYQLDLSDLLRSHPNSLFMVRLLMNPVYSTYPCSEEKESQLKSVKQTGFQDWEDMYVESEPSAWDSWSGNEGEGGDGEAGEDENSGRYDDPCSPYYYTRDASQNFISSDVGLIAKQGRDGQLFVSALSISGAEPMSGVSLQVFNFQNQKIAEGQTSSDGQWTGTPKGVPFYIRAQSGGKMGYLKVNVATALTVSHFEVGGEEIQRGLKGYIYGERGVWRPGDSLYLTFALVDPQNTLPENHPVRMELRTPTNSLFGSQTQNLGKSGFNTFRMATDPSSPTGAWRVKVSVGDVSFEKGISIETVKPNHLKVNMDFGSDTLYSTDFSGSVFSQWLHGADAAGLKTDVNVSLSGASLKFGRYADYEFNDPVRTFEGERSEIFSGILGNDSRAEFTSSLSIENPPPGLLEASFSTRVFEESGDFSIDRIRVPLHYYDNYVGIKTPKGDVSRGMLLTDTTHRILISGISNKGKPVNLKKVLVSISKVEWQWWWEKSAYNLSSYESRSNFTVLQQGEIEVKNGQGVWDFKINYPEWGRYLIRACDASASNAHCTGKIVYIDWPGWAGRAGAEDGGAGATMLSLSSDKKKYNVGETAILQIPAGKSGRALLSIENGSRILSSQWLETVPGTNKVELKITADMAPNVYAHVTLVQPHRNKDNDLPIRLYGVIPLLVEDPETHLEPMVSAPKEIRPNTKLDIQVREKNGKAMDYTLAIVDEGLLGLTRFQTPDLWKEFNKKEALGIKTWDMYDYVAGAYGSSLERMLALGGDGTGSGGEEQGQKRFPPLVRFYGPLHLAAGQTATVEVPIPEYMGAVRAMVVAGKGLAFGLAEQSILVKRPLMVLATIPRVMRPDEEAVIPVTVFAMQNGLGDVTVSLKTQGLQVLGASEQIVSLNKSGEKLVYFRVRSPGYLGGAKLAFTAKAKGEVATQNTDLQIVAPNPRSTISVNRTLEPHASWSDSLAFHGITGTNRQTLYLSRIPDLNLESHLNALIGYPHGCVEQTTSKAFPQLYLKDLVQLSPQRLQDVLGNVTAGIQKLKTFQIYDGSFSYWPGNEAGDPWATSYVGHFLLEASRQGYAVPPEMLSRWKQYQTKEAGKWSSVANSRDEEVQSYRLFTLALAGVPDMGAMNRLRENVALASLPRLELAAAYALAGRKDVALEQAGLAEKASPGAVNADYYYGEDLRNSSMQLLMRFTAGKSQQTFELAKDIASKFGTQSWWSTQSTAWALMALSRTYGGSSAKTIKATLAINNQNPQAFQTEKPILLESLKAGGNANRKMQFTVTSHSDVPVFVRIANSGISPAGTQQKESVGLSLVASFTDLEGRSLGVSNVGQGTDFVYWISVSNTTNRPVQNVALTQLVPSGWEILNTRLDGTQSASLGGVKADRPDYFDQRDDRVYSYFSLTAGATKKFPILVHSSYLGEFLMPGAYAEAMYDNNYKASLEGAKTKVVE
jgi:uncharacterized protein YfaS (alpha-2-macroglobulin family)